MLEARQLKDLPVVVILSVIMVLKMLHETQFELSLAGKGGPATTAPCVTSEHVAYYSTL